MTQRVKGHSTDFNMEEEERKGDSQFTQGSDRREGRENGSKTGRRREHILGTAATDCGS